jgi:ribosomal protein S12 methylthiotransferase accessory factor YcaO
LIVLIYICFRRNHLSLPIKKGSHLARGQNSHPRKHRAVAIKEIVQKRMTLFTMQRKNHSDGTFLEILSEKPFKFAHKKGEPLSKARIAIQENTEQLLLKRQYKSV